MTKKHQTPKEHAERESRRRQRLVESSGLSPEQTQKLAASARKIWDEWNPQPGDTDRPLEVEGMPKKFGGFLEKVLEEYIRRKKQGPER